MEHIWDSTYHQDWITRGSFWSTLVPPFLYEAMLVGAVGALRAEPGLEMDWAKLCSKASSRANTESGGICESRLSNDKVMLTWY